MTTFFPFAVVASTGGGFADQVILNVVEGTWREWDNWRGRARTAFDGRMLSTLHRPKRRWAFTVEFANGAALESFLIFIASGKDPITDRYSGLRQMFMYGFSGTVNNMLRGLGRVAVVLIEPGERSVVRTSIQPTDAETPEWQLELTVSEV